MQLSIGWWHPVLCSRFTQLPRMLFVQSSRILTVQWSRESSPTPAGSYKRAVCLWSSQVTSLASISLSSALPSPLSRVSVWNWHPALLEAGADSTTQYSLCFAVSEVWWHFSTQARPGESDSQARFLLDHIPATGCGSVTRPELQSVSQSVLILRVHCKLTDHCSQIYILL